MGGRGKHYNAGHPSWNKGLTKETDERVAAYSERLKFSQKGRIPWNKGNKAPLKERTLLNTCSCGCKQKCHGKFVFGHQNRGQPGHSTGHHPSKESSQKSSRRMALDYIEGRRKVHDNAGRGTRCYYFCKLTNSEKCLRSTYERRFAEWLDFNNVLWEYEPKRFKLNKLNASYCPDFYIPSLDKWFETKGYFSEVAKAKFENFLEEYPNVKIQLVFRKDLDFLDKIRTLSERPDEQSLLNDL